MDQSSPQNTAPTETLLAWQATTSPVHERSKRWYIVASCVLVLGVIYGLFSGAWSFVVVLLLCGGMYALLHNHVPQPKNIAITREGVTINGELTRYDALAQFWIIETPQYHELHLASRGKKRGEIVIQTGAMDVSLIRATLAQFLEEAAEKKETLIDIFIRICKL